MYPLYRKQSLPVAKYTEPIYSLNPNNSIKIFQSPTRPIDPYIHLNKVPKNSINIMQPSLPRLSYGSIPSTNSSTSSTQNQTCGNSQHTLSNSGSKLPSLELLEVLPALKELEIRVVSLSEAVLHHQKLLSNLNTPKLVIAPFNSNSSGNGGGNSTDSNQIVQNIIELINQEIEKRSREEKLLRLKERQNELFNHSKMMVEISRVKQEILREVNDKMSESKHHLTDILKKQTETQIMSMYEVNREVFRRIEIDMNQLRQLIQKSKSSTNLNNTSTISSITSTNLNKSSSQPTSSLFSSNRKFSDPCMIRYRQVIDKVKIQPSLLFSNIRVGNHYVPTTEPVVINQVIYYLDKEFNLLDNQFNYLVDQNGENIQLEERCVELLKENRILEMQESSGVV